MTQDEVYNFCIDTAYFKAITNKTKLFEELDNYWDKNYKKHLPFRCNAWFDYNYVYDNCIYPTIDEISLIKNQCFLVCENCFEARVYDYTKKLPKCIECEINSTFKHINKEQYIYSFYDETYLINILALDTELDNTYGSEYYSDLELVDTIYEKN